MATQKSSSPEIAVGRFEAAFAKTAKARAALERAALIPINLDVQVVVTTVLSALPRVRSLRDEVQRALPEFDLAQFDKLEVYAEALAYAQTAYLAASDPIESLPTLVARGVELRDQLTADATALARRNLLDARSLSELKGGNGYLNVGSDVGVLVRMLRSRWSDIQGKSAIQPEELDEAERLFERITVAYAERTQSTDRGVAASDDRARAYALVIRTYDQARRAISFLRWDEADAEKFAPSLWAGRGGRPAQKPAPADGPGDGSHGPVPPVDAGHGNGNGVSPVTPEPVVTPGMPGGSPFANG